MAAAIAPLTAAGASFGGDGEFVDERCARAVRLQAFGERGDLPGDVADLAAALHPVGLAEHLLHVPLGLVVGEDAGAEAAARPDHPRQGGGGVGRVGMADAPVSVAVDRVLSPLAGFEAERAGTVEFTLVHPPAEVRLEPGDSGQRPDAAPSEAVAGGGVLEGVEVFGRDVAVPGRGRPAAQHLHLRRGGSQAGADPPTAGA